MPLADAIDLVKNAAGGAQRALGGVREAARVSGNAFRWAGQFARVEMAPGLRAIRSGAAAVVDPLARMGRGVGGVVQSMGKFTRSSLDTLAVLGQIPGVAAGLNAVASLGAAGARYAMDAFAFKEQTQFGLEILTRSSSKAQEMMGFADELARSLGKSTSEVGGGVRDLLAKGFDPEMIRQIVSGMADLSTINPEANVKLLTMAVGQVKSKGFLMMEELRGQIAEQGLDIQSVYKHIAQNLGIQQDEVEKAISGKKVTADLGITSVLQAIQDMGGGGPLGAVSAAKAVRTVGGAFDNARAMGERMLLAVNTGPVGSRMIAFAGRIANLFDPASDSGKRLLGVFDTASSKVSEWVDGISLDDLSAGFDRATTSARGFVTAASGFGGGLLQGYREASDTIDDLGRKLGVSQGAAEGTGNGFQAIGKALGYVGAGLGLVVDLVTTIPHAFSELGGSMKIIGNAISEGMTAGIESAKHRVLQTLNGLVEALPLAARKLLGIASPSRVFAQIGGFVTEGMNIGLESEPSPSERMRELITPPPIKRPVMFGAMASNSAAAASAAATTTGAPIVIQVSLTVHVDARGASNPTETAELTASALERPLAALLERAVLQSGLKP